MKFIQFLVILFNLTELFQESIKECLEIANEQLSKVNTDKIDSIDDSSNLVNLANELYAKASSIRSKLNSKITTDSITSILFPAMRWYQTTSEVGLTIKLTTKQSAPGIIKTENLIHNLNGRLFTFTAEGFVNNIRKKYSFSLDLFHDVHNDQEVQQGSVGVMFVNFKKTHQFQWPRVFDDENIQKYHDQKINYDKMTNVLDEDDLMDLSDGNIINLNYRILKNMDVNGKYNSSLINKVKKNEITWKRFYETQKLDDYNDEFKKRNNEQNNLKKGSNENIDEEKIKLREEKRKQREFEMKKKREYEEKRKKAENKKNDKKN